MFPFFCVTLYLSLNILKVIKWWRMKWTGHVRLTGKEGLVRKLWRKETTWKTCVLEWQTYVKIDFKERVWGCWSGLIWLNVGTNGRLFWARKWTFGSHKMWWISWVSVEMLALQVGLSSLKLRNFWCVFDGLQSYLQRNASFFFFELPLLLVIYLF